MAAVTTAPGLPVSQVHADSTSLTTLPDPRTPKRSPNLSRHNSVHHPDLSSEVATLSNKLITAINQQTTLDDTLSAARQELDASQERVRQLEAQVQEHDDLLASGVLVRKTDVEADTVQLMESLAREQHQRGVLEKDKRVIEQELESLTTALFEEANEMVAAARKERELAERRNEQLRTQLKDTELLLASHQEQLAELKMVMQQMSGDREDSEHLTNSASTPSTPSSQTHEPMSTMFDAVHPSPNSPGNDDHSSAPPLTFSQLLRPVLRHDLQAYDDFHSLMQASRKSSPSSRVASGSFGGLNVVGLGTLGSRDPTPQPTNLPSSASSTSLSTSISHSSPVLPSTPASTNSGFASRDGSSSIISLKETRFYKRVLIEDIEPTLRLDAAPGLSWLARRTVINSMCEGSLVVEPMPAAARLYIFSCSLCGESRRGNAYERTHRFRTSDNENAQRYPLCPYCLNRLRASCDFLGFLRIVKDGHWKTDCHEAETQAWEESVRLRERMLWTRIGGGVIPAFVRSRETPRSSVEHDAEGSNASQPMCRSMSPSFDSNKPSSPRQSTDPFISEEVLPSTDMPDVSHTEHESSAKAPWTTTKHPAALQDKTLENSVPVETPIEKSKEDLKDSLESEPPAEDFKTSSTNVLPAVVEESKDSQIDTPITIPGAFES